MKVIAILLAAVATLATVQANVGPIVWAEVTPIWQAPAFLLNFPILRRFLSRNIDENNGFIRSGTPAEEEQFPWVVGLVFHLEETNGFCGGTLITPDYVLTAAHCAQMSRSGIAVAGSVHIKNSANVEQQRVTFSSATVHPMWDASNFANDLALIRLDTPFELSPTVQLARLPTDRHLGSDYTGMLTQTAGWGSIAPWVSPNMRFIENAISARISCVMAFPTMVSPFSVCTSGAVSSPCQGDSGVPMTITEEDNNQTVIGVLSFGSAMGCGSTRPAVYTLVQPYTSWIDSVVGGPVVLPLN